MQVYLQYKYYITVTKTGDGTPYRSHRYVLLKFRGNVVMKMGTQQQHNNQDRYVNKLNKASQAIQSPRTVPFFLLVSLLDGYSFPNVLVKGIVAFEH